VLLALVLVVSKLEPKLVIVLQRKQLLLRQSGLGQVVVVHEQVQVQVVNHNKAVVAGLVEKFESSRVALVVDWGRLDIGEGRILLVVRVRVVVVPEGLLEGV
jgi:hypothetical protein